MGSTESPVHAWLPNVPGTICREQTGGTLPTAADPVVSLGAYVCTKDCIAAVAPPHTPAAAHKPARPRSKLARSRARSRPAGAAANRGDRGRDRSTGAPPAAVQAADRGRSRSRSTAAAPATAAAADKQHCGAAPVASVAALAALAPRTSRAAVAALSQEALATVENTACRDARAVKRGTLSLDAAPAAAKKQRGAPDSARGRAGGKSTLPAMSEEELDQSRAGTAVAREVERARGVLPAGAALSLPEIDGVFLRSEAEAEAFAAAARTVLAWKGSIIPFERVSLYAPQSLAVRVAAHALAR